MITQGFGFTDRVVRTVPDGALFLLPLASQSSVAHLAIQNVGLALVDDLRQLLDVDSRPDGTHLGEAEHIGVRHGELPHSFHEPVKAISKAM